MGRGRTWAGSPLCAAVGAALGPVQPVGAYFSLQAMTVCKLFYGSFLGDG